MIKAGAIAKGMFLLIKNTPHYVVDREFVNPGKGSAFVRLKMKNLLRGNTVNETIKTADSVEEIDVINKNAQYLYSDAENYFFMDSDTYEQYHVPIEGLEDRQYFLKEGEIYQVMVWEDKPIDILIPYKMTFKVTEAAKAIKGDTVTGATKVVTLETGLKIKVPLFIKQDDLVVINTETKEYYERAKE
ncbi:MAG: elongation factor P [Spirochaetales bacterium]|nr:elongation factor P [Spirochaetales bacterium]